MSDLKAFFVRVDFDLSYLFTYIDIGDIGLPDIQRPFVWSNRRILREIDSQSRADPIG